MHKSTSRQSGFTLLELIVTLGMIGILAMIGVPLMSEWTQRTQVRGETQRYMGILTLARSTAINTNQVTTIAILDEDGDGLVELDVFIDNGGEGNEAFDDAGAPPDEYVRRFELEQTSVNVVLDPDTDFISFDGNGRLMGAELEIDLQNENESLGRVITINLMGRASVAEKDF